MAYFCAGKTDFHPPLEFMYSHYWIIMSKEPNQMFIWFVLKIDRGYFDLVYTKDASMALRYETRKNAEEDALAMTLATGVKHKPRKYCWP